MIYDISRSFFHFFKILIFQVVSEIKGQNMAQNDKIFCLLHSISQEPYILWLSFVVHKCKVMIFPGVFFNFFKILIFRVVSAIKGQKMARNDKKLCLLHSISQEPYMIWLVFVLHKCKMIIFLGFFSIFSKLWFFGLFRTVKRAKNGSKWQKLCHALYLRNHTSYDFHLWCTCVKEWHLQMHFSFF